MRPKLFIDKFGCDDNIFNIAGLAAKLVPNKYNEIIDAVINSNSFDDAIRRIRKYVDIIFVESA